LLNSFFKASPLIFLKIEYVKENIGIFFNMQSKNTIRKIIELFHYPVDAFNESYEAGLVEDIISTSKSIQSNY